MPTSASLNWAPDPLLPKGSGPPWVARGTWGTRTHLHPDDGIDEEKHGNQQTDIRQGLVGRKLDKSPADHVLSKTHRVSIAGLHSRFSYSGGGQGLLSLSALSRGGGSP